MNNLVSVKLLKQPQSKPLKLKGLTRNTALLFPNLAKGKAERERNFISAWADSSTNPLFQIEDYNDKNIFSTICNDKLIPDTPNSTQQVLDETLDHKLLPVLSSNLQSRKSNLLPYKNYKKMKMLGKGSPIYSSKTCLKVSEHSFEKIPEDGSLKNPKKI